MSEQPVLLCCGFGFRYYDEDRSDREQLRNRVHEKGALLTPDDLQCVQCVMDHAAKTAMDLALEDGVSGVIAALFLGPRPNVTVFDTQTLRYSRPIPVPVALSEFDQPDPPIVDQFIDAYLASSESVWPY